MTAEVLQHLRPERGGLFVDCTVGLGGHSRALLETRRHTAHRPRSRSRRACTCGRNARAVARSGRAGACRLPVARRRARRPAAWRRSTARWPTSACPRCSSTNRDAASASSATNRSTCAWTAPAARPPPSWSPAWTKASWPTSSSSSARSASRGALPGRSFASASRRRSIRPPVSPPSFVGRSRAAATRASIRRRARSRRCASGSTASSTGSIGSSRRPSGACGPARGWSSSLFTRSKIASSNTRFARSSMAARRASGC